MQHMTHANPVPNYVSMIKKNSNALELSKEQMDQVMAWNKANGPKMRSKVMSVIDGEKQMKLASLNGESASNIMNIAKRVLDTRLDIIKGKTRCRDHIKSVLNESQWIKLAALVKS